MKTSLTILCLATALNLSAQSLKESDVPDNVKTSFKQMYPHAEKIGWEKEKGNFEAEFKGPGKNGKTVNRSVILDPKGTFVQEEIEIESSDLPAGVNDYVKNSLGGKKISECCLINLPTGEANYEVKVDKNDYLFDGSGKFLAKEASVDKNMDGVDD